MENIYGNVDHELKPTTSPRPPTGVLGPRATGTGRSWSRPVVLGLGLLCVLLLAGLLVLGLQYVSTVHELSAIQSELTKQQNELSSLIEERNQQNSSFFSGKQKFIKLLKEYRKTNKTCPVGWKKFKSTCYHLSDQKNSWTNSRHDCTERGADLVVVEGSQEQEFLSEYKADFWIGLSDQDQEGTWQWIDGAPLNLSHWEFRQPDNGDNNPAYGEEDCAHFKQSSFKWNDISCDSKFKWICEKPETVPLTLVDEYLHD